MNFKQSFPEEEEISSNSLYETCKNQRKAVKAVQKLKYRPRCLMNLNKDKTKQKRNSLNYGKCNPTMYFSKTCNMTEKDLFQV